MKFLLVISALVVCTYAYSVKPHFATFASSKERIIGGIGAERNQFPYQLSFEWGVLGIWQHICGAVLITDSTALSAGHCVTESPGIGSFRIVAGILNLDDHVPTRQVVNIQTNIVHPDYAGGVAPHDLVVLRLQANLFLNEAIQPIALPQAGSVPSGYATLSGWGATSGGIFPGMPNQLQWTPKAIAPYEECRQLLIALLGEAGPLDPTNVCTGAVGSSISACSGDSGGPLTQDDVLIGIVSWGITPCGTNGAPSVYAGVSNYIDWINANTV